MGDRKREKGREGRRETGREGGREKRRRKGTGRTNTSLSSQRTQVPTPRSSGFASLGTSYSVPAPVRV